jgi:hypothetical protein
MFTFRYLYKKRMKHPLSLLTILAFFYSGCIKAPPPDEPEKVSIISIAPTSGPAGTTVVIKGTHFAADPSENIVKFNNSLASVFSSSGDSLVVTAPANGTSGPVTVTVDGSIAAGPVFTYTVDSVDVYAAAPAYGVVSWKNGKEIFLAPTVGNTGGAYGLAVADTDVYVGGFTHFINYPGFEAAYWKNGKKTALSSPDSAGEVRALLLSGNDLYIGGSENYKPVYWKNGVKYRLSGYDYGYARVNALAINGNDVYAAGYGGGPNNEERSIYWKNGVETVLGKNGQITIGATSITTNGNDVYVCAIDSGNAVYWKNGVRVTLAKYVGNTPLAANAIAIMGNTVYVAGSYGGEAVYWKDGTKITLPKRGLYARASAITFYQSDIYIGGADGNTPVYWKNGVEVVLCCSEGGAVSAIAVRKKQ